MLILLPPSETKTAGGSGPVLDLPALSFPQLTPQREQVLDALVSLSGDEDEAARVLKLSARQRDQIADNRVIRSAPTMPAVDRYTGVLFDALDAASLDAPARRWLGRHVAIHSAPLGPVGALDPLPMYRLAAGARLPGLAPLRQVWADAVSRAIADRAPRFVLDLRSEAYVALGPLPSEVPGAYVRVVTAEADGRVRALNHFNKAAKGRFVRTLAQDRPRAGTVAGLVRWAEGVGIPLHEASASQLDLVV